MLWPLNEQEAKFEVEDDLPLRSNCHDAIGTGRQILTGGELERVGVYRLDLLGIIERGSQIADYRSIITVQIRAIARRFRAKNIPIGDLPPDAGEFGLGDEGSLELENMLGNNLLDFGEMFARQLGTEIK
jgi:hypothetical protein